MEYLQSLNDKQLEAVQHTEGYLRVIAGAGSGKTKLLVSRYAYLVKEYGINSANVLCVTFTNKAAGEMKRRIRALIGGEYDTSLICTYHGFCVRVLREDVEKIFYPKEFQIIDTAQQKAVLGEIYQKFELKLDHGSFEKIVRQIGDYKSRNRDYVGRMCLSEKCQIKNSVETLDDRIIEEYLQHQKQVFAMDFQDLMYFTLDLFARCPEVLGKWQERLNYIQVDEFQDSSATELELIDLLSAKHKNLMIVGDPDQNIYEWRGSDVKLLVDFDKTHLPTETIFLNRNYRSTPQILACANALIEKNLFRLKKELFTKSASGAEVCHYHMKNDYAEAEKIVELILDTRKSTEASFSDFAVLYRSGFLSRIIEKKFTECGIPYEIFGSVKFYHRMEVQDLIAYLRLVAFEDDVAFKRIVNKPRRRFGRIKLQALQGMQTDASLFATLCENADAPVFKNSGAAEFAQTISGLIADAEHMSISETVEAVCSRSGYEKYIRELGDMERFENLTEFKRIAAEYEENLGERVTLKEFLNQIALQSEDDGEESAEKVKLMTIHAAKGLEFPNVFVIGFSEGIFPSSKTIEERKALGLEEERRLCYVAITRAEKRLFLFDNEGFTQGGSQKLPSRFLREIGEENYRSFGKISGELWRQSEAYAAKQMGEELPAEERPKVGDRVEHPAFGSGVVLERTPQNLRIRFDRLSSDRVISPEFFSKKRTLPVLPRPSETSNEPTPENKLQSSVSKEKEQKNTAVQEKKLVAEQKEEQLAPQKAPIPEPTEHGYEKTEEITVEEQRERTHREEENRCAEELEVPLKKPNLSEYENLWNREDLPKTGWVCIGVTDLGEPSGVCEMCGKQIIRYVHHMKHPNFGTLGVGCICAGKMEGDVEGAKQREQDFKNKESRRQSFLNRRWKRSKNNNSYLKIKDHLIVLYFSRQKNNWKYSLDNEFCVEVFPDSDSAKNAAFEALDAVIKKAEM